VLKVFREFGHGDAAIIGEILAGAPRIRVLHA
jgi:hypothetical protein